MVVNARVVLAFRGDDLSHVSRRCVNIIREAIYQCGGRALSIGAVNLPSPDGSILPTDDGLGYLQCSAVAFTPHVAHMS